MEEKLNGEHGGESVDPAEAKNGECPTGGQSSVKPPAESGTKEAVAVKPAKRAPRGLSVGPFLIGLGILLITLAALCAKCGFRDYIGVMAVAGLGGASLVVIGIIYGSICTYLTLRRRGSRALWALSTLVLLFSASALIAMMGLAPPLTKFASMYGRRTCSTEAQLHRQQRSEAYATIDAIAWGVHRLKEDIPAIAIFALDGDEPGKRVDYLYGDMGKLPLFSDEARKSWGGISENMHFVLATNGRGAPRFKYKVSGWDGSYLRRDVGEDPWGYAYLISVSGLEGGSNPDNKVWCISAGPNHIVDTPAYANELKGDDLGRHQNALSYASSQYTCGPGGCTPRKK